MSTPPDQLAPPAPWERAIGVPGPHRPWYRRWPAWVAAVVAVAVGASIVTDLPQRSTSATRASQVADVLRQINTDLHACSFAAAQSFSIYERIKSGTFPSSDRSLVPKYLSDDQQACSFEDQAIYSVSTVTVPNTAAGSDLSSLIKSALEWATSDAVGAIVDIETLVNHPRNATALGDLAKREHLLSVDRAAAERHRAAADRTVSTLPLPRLGLPVLPGPST